MPALDIDEGNGTHNRMFGFCGIEQNPKNKELAPAANTIYQYNNNGELVAAAIKWRDIDYDSSAGFVDVIQFDKDLNVYVAKPLQDGSGKLRIWNPTYSICFNEGFFSRNHSVEFNSGLPPGTAPPCPSLEQIQSIANGLNDESFLIEGGGIVSASQFKDNWLKNLRIDIYNQAKRNNPYYALLLSIGTEITRAEGVEGLNKDYLKLLKIAQKYLLNQLQSIIPSAVLNGNNDTPWDNFTEVGQFGSKLEELVIQKYNSAAKKYKTTTVSSADDSKKKTAGFKPLKQPELPPVSVNPTISDLEKKQAQIEADNKIIYVSSSGVNTFSQPAGDPNNIYTILDIMRTETVSPPINQGEQIQINNPPQDNIDLGNVRKACENLLSKLSLPNLKILLQSLYDQLKYGAAEIGKLLLAIKKLLSDSITQFGLMWAGIVDVLAKVAELVKSFNGFSFDPKILTQVIQAMKDGIKKLQNLLAEAGKDVLAAGTSITNFIKNIPGNVEAAFKAAVQAAQKAISSAVDTFVKVVEEAKINLANLPVLTKNALIAAIRSIGQAVRGAVQQVFIVLKEAQAILTTLPGKIRTQALAIIAAIQTIEEGLKKSIDEFEKVIEKVITDLSNVIDQAVGQVGSAVRAAGQAIANAASAAGQAISAAAQAAEGAAKQAIDNALRIARDAVTTALDVIINIIKQAKNLLSLQLPSLNFSFLQVAKKAFSEAVDKVIKTAGEAKDAFLNQIKKNTEALKEMLKKISFNDIGLCHVVVELVREANKIPNLQNAIQTIQTKIPKNFQNVVVKLVALEVINAKQLSFSSFVKDVSTAITVRTTQEAIGVAAATTVEATKSAQSAVQSIVSQVQTRGLSPQSIVQYGQQFFQQVATSTAGATVDASAAAVISLIQNPV